MHIEKIQQNIAPRVPELIMQALVKAIEDGHIRVGEDMPSERDLAEMLGVGRGSLRECLAILEFLGAIDGRGNRKVLLRDADYIQKARSWIECSNEMGGTEPFNEFRRVIEVGIVGLACERATEEDMAALDEAIRNLDEDPANYMHDVEFHDALAVASHNAMLASTIHLVNNLIADVRMRFWDLPSYKELTQQTHHEIAKAPAAENAGCHADAQCRVGKFLRDAGHDQREGNDHDETGRRTGAEDPTGTAALPLPLQLPCPLFGRGQSFSCCAHL